MPRSTIARIDLAALRHNYRFASERAGSARAMAVVKADGYGHGIGEVARALAEEAPKYAVACLEEAEAIFARMIAMLTEGDRDPADAAIEAGFEDELEGLTVFAGVRDYPSRVKCATLAWHAFHEALEGDGTA